jgi:hypothetical protein
MNLTEHFTFEELTHTSHSAFTQAQKACGSTQVDNLRATAKLLEEVRAYFDAPVIIHSGYRCKALNAFIGGSKTSQHLVGQAADFHVEGHSLQDVFDFIRKSTLRFGQCILEGAAPNHPTWIHLSIETPAFSRQVLTYDGTRYHKLEN